MARPILSAWKVPGGESYCEMVTRVHGFLADLREVDEPAVLVVTHHEVLQAVAGHFQNLDLARMWLVWIGNCEILEFGRG